MNAKELRIGNIIQVLGEPKEVLSIEENISFGGYKLMYEKMASGDRYCALSMISPIPLTEDWLIKAGFRGMSTEWRVIGSFKFPKSNWEIFSRPERPSIFWDIDNGYSHLELSLEYVHQLQNLYFALTGKELTIKQ